MDACDTPYAPVICVWGQVLGSLAQKDSASFERAYAELLALVCEGGPAVPEARRRARALARSAGCEMSLELPLLCQLLMSPHGDSELRTLNPLLSEVEVRQYSKTPLLPWHYYPPSGLMFTPQSRLLPALGGGGVQHLFY